MPTSHFYIIAVLSGLVLNGIWKEKIVCYCLFSLILIKYAKIQPNKKYIVFYCLIVINANLKKTKRCLFKILLNISIFSLILIKLNESWKLITEKNTSPVIGNLQSLKLLKSWGLFSRCSEEKTSHVSQNSTRARGGGEFPKEIFTNFRWDDSYLILAHFGYLYVSQDTNNL